MTPMEYLETWSVIRFLLPFDVLSLALLNLCYCASFPSVGMWIVLSVYPLVRVGLIMYFGSTLVRLVVCAVIVLYLAMLIPLGVRASVGEMNKRLDDSRALERFRTLIRKYTRMTSVQKAKYKNGVDEFIMCESWQPILVWTLGYPFHLVWNVWTFVRLLFENLYEVLKQFTLTFIFYPAYERFKDTISEVIHRVMKTA